MLLLYACWTLYHQPMPLIHGTLQDVTEILITLEVVQGVSQVVKQHRM